MIPIGDYIFDSKRLVFIPKSMGENDFRSFLASTPINDDVALSILAADKVAKSPRNTGNYVFPHVGICLTYDCQLRCAYCSFRSEERHADNIKVEDVGAYLRHMVKAMIMNRRITGKDESLSIHITGGGEPTYHWQEFKRIVEYVDRICKESEINYSLHLTTNGILSPDKISFISKHFQSVMISYDGLPDIQNRNRHLASETGTAHILDDTLNLFSEAMQGKGLIVRTTIWPEDYSRLREMADKVLSSYSISQWDIMPVLPQGRAEDAVANSQSYTGDFLDYYLDLLGYAKEHHTNAVITTPFFPNGLASQYCGALGIECPWLLPSGKIVSCLEGEGFEPEIGHVSNGVVSFVTTESSPLAEHILNLLSDCEECIAFRFCRGGCPVSHMRKTAHSKKSRKWQCQQIVRYYQYVFSQILQNRPCFNWSVEPLKGNLQVLRLRCNTAQPISSSDARF